MSENGTVTAGEENNSAADAMNTENTESAESAEIAVNPEDVSYHAVEKDGSISAIWEMKGRRHIRTIDPRSNEGKQILALFETAA